MKLLDNKTIELDDGRVVQPLYMDTDGDWQDTDLSAYGLSGSEITEAKALWTTSAKNTFKSIFGATGIEE